MFLIYEYIIMYVNPDELHKEPAPVYLGNTKRKHSQNTPIYLIFRFQLNCFEMSFLLIILLNIFINSGRYLAPYYKYIRQSRLTINSWI